MTTEKKLCKVCGEFEPITSFEISTDVCKWCDVTVRDKIADRLEYLRQELRAERISYGELSELQDLAEYIAPGDVELLEAAGVPEGGQ